ncbi:MAG: hypothetical protein R2834_20205 [Rhodothermales bacterium]
MQPFRTLLSLLLVVTAFSACKSTEPVQTPDAGVVALASMPMEERLVQAHIQALGGMENLKNVQSITMQAEVSMMGMNMPLKMYMKRPGMMRNEVDVTAMNMKIVTGYDGTTAWTINPMIGPGAQVLAGSQARGVVEQAQIDGILVDYAEKGYTVTFLGEEAVGGKPAHKLKVDRPDSTPVILYLDAVSHLPVKQEGEGIDPQSGNAIQVTTMLSDYRTVGGIMMPYQMEMELGGAMSQKVTMKEIVVNADISDSIFELPVSSN